MIHQVVTRVSLDSFLEKSAGKKVVLLYPWTNYRNLFLTHFLQSAKDGLLYYRLLDNPQSVGEWLSTLVEEFDQVLGGFGSNLRDALNNNDPQALGEAFAADLAAYRDERLILFIDELDRAPLDSDFNMFVEALVDALPQNVQIAFSSRLLNYVPWYEMIANGDAVVLGTEYRRSDVMFTIEDQPKPQVEVYAFGRGHAIVNGKEITNWDGALPRNLFFYFMDKEMVTRDDIFDTFWPDLEVREATNVFHVTKRKISERITTSVDDDGNYELTMYSSSFYQPSDKVIRHYDVGDFNDAVDLAMTANDDEQDLKERLFREAIDLYKAPFLETINMPWVEARRKHLRDLLGRALVGLGQIKKDQGNFEEALGVLTRAVKEIPEREDVHREVIDTYLKLDMPADARLQYNRLADMLHKRFKLTPDRRTRDLIEAVDPV